MIRIHEDSTEYVIFPVVASSTSSSANPTTAGLEVAVAPLSESPESGWVEGSWQTDTSTNPDTYYPRVLIGPDGDIDSLVPGEYVIWWRLTNNPEVIVGPVAVIEIYTSHLSATRVWPITVGDVEKHLNRSFTTTEQSGIDSVIDDMCAETESIINRPITQREFTTSHLLRQRDYRPDGRVSIRLESPIVTVASVSIDGDALTTDQYVTWPWGIDLLPPMLNATSTPPLVEVEYTAGYSLSEVQDLLGKIKPAIIREAVRIVDQYQATDTADIEGYKVRLTGGSQSAYGFTDHERNALGKSRFRRRLFR